MLRKRMETQLDSRREINPHRGLAIRIVPNDCKFLKLTQFLTHAHKKTFVVIKNCPSMILKILNVS